VVSTDYEWLHGGTPLLHQDASGRQGCAVSGRLAKRIKYAMPSPTPIARFAWLRDRERA
jgi:hypothetical protein